MKKVSIIVPVYNLENSIEKCIKSLITQTYTNLELIFIDDGSIDQSLFICEKYAKIDSRIKILYHENKGVSYTRNCGLDIASGEYLMFIDGDDIIDVDCIERYVKEALSNNADVVIGGITFVSKNGNSKELYPKINGNFKNNIWNSICKDDTGIYGYVSNKLYRMSVIQNNNIRFNVKMVAQEDLDFALSVYNRCINFRVIQYSGYNYFYLDTRKQHPYDQYISNKLKMLSFAQKNTKLSEESKEKVISDIENLLYVALYENTMSSMKKICKHYREIEGLSEALSYKKKYMFVIKLFKNKCDILIMGYFWGRKSISKLIHKKIALVNRHLGMLKL